MSWYAASSRPGRPGVYRVQVPYPSYGEKLRVEERYARWTGAHWCCWALSIEAANRCVWKGPSAGYLWAELSA